VNSVFRAAAPIVTVRNKPGAAIVCLLVICSRNTIIFSQILNFHCGGNGGSSTS